LNGTVSSNGAPTTVTFEFGTTTAYGAMGSPVAAVESPLAASATTAPVTAMLSSLACGTTYHFRVDADNTAGQVVGADQTFATSACPAGAPTAATIAASAITATTATLNGLVSANGSATDVTFEYGTTPAYAGAGSPIVATQSPLPPTAVNAAASVSLGGLTCGTTYHFRVDASNGAGAVSGSDATFATSACPTGTPTATSGAASSVTATSAVLNGTVSSNGAATTVTFSYGTTPAYGGPGSPIPAAQSPLSANATNAPVSASLGGLSCGTTYHFLVGANNGTGSTVTGADKTFTTSTCPAGGPTAASGAASNITSTSATLSGTASSNGATTNVAFEYGPTVAYGAIGSPIVAAQSPLLPTASNAPVSADLAGLGCGTVYHYRVTANNGTGGTILGADRTFTTAACASPQTTFSGPTITHTGIATARISGGGPACGFATAALVGAPASPPQGVTFPDGLFDFTTSGCVGPVTVTVTFPTAFQSGEDYWKFGAEPGQPAPHWYVLGAGQNLSLSGHVATFVLSDGAVGDDDGVANGTIRDPGGPGVVGGGSGGGPGGEGAAPLPALGDVARALLAAIMLLLGARAAMARRGFRA
jgi:phosphodiesterase/alkaline phosphatase D-like protein